MEDWMHSPVMVAKVHMIRATCDVGTASPKMVWNMMPKMSHSACGKERTTCDEHGRSVWMMPRRSSPSIGR